MKQAPISNEEWLITNEYTAFYGQGTAAPGKSGTTVVFAHAKKGLFVYLPILKKGDFVFITQDKKVYTYKIYTKKAILPSELGFITPHGNNALALFTCYGLRNEKRILYFAELFTEFEKPTIDKNLYNI